MDVRVGTASDIACTALQGAGELLDGRRGNTVSTNSFIENAMQAAEPPFDRRWMNK